MQRRLSLKIFTLKSIVMKNHALKNSEHDRHLFKYHSLLRWLVYAVLVSFLVLFVLFPVSCSHQEK